MARAGHSLFEGDARTVLAQRSWGSSHRRKGFLDDDINLSLIFHEQFNREWAAMPGVNGVDSQAFQSLDAGIRRG